MKNRSKPLLISAAILGLSGSIAFGTSAFAGCYFVACPNQAVQQQPQYQPQPQTQYSNETDDSFSEGYSKGYYAGKKAASKTKAKKSSQGKIAKKTSKTYVSKTVKSKPAKSAHIVKKPVKSKTVYYSNSANKNHYSYNPNSIQDSAKIYGANKYGPSVNVAAFAGRGEKWVSSSYKVISYTTPSNIQWVNGRQCGWGMPIASNGNIMKNNTWVCRCETGWRPDN